MNHQLSGSEWEPFEATEAEPWTVRHAAHLLRRAGFGGTIQQINDATRIGLNATVDSLLDFSQAKQFSAEMETSARLLSGGQDSKSLAAWWLLRMVQSPCPLQEKLTLFWHGHFA